jgi:hypothetical protein
VKFNTWGNKAVITLGEKNKYKWKYDNFWGTKWAISKDTERLITYNSSTAGGEIESSSDSDALLLSGFFIHNHYLTILIVIAVSTVIIASR